MTLDPRPAGVDVVGNPGTVLVPARASSESGHAARRLAVDDLWTAVEALESLHGRPYTGHLPSKQDLVERLRTQTPIESFQDGVRFIHRVLEVDLRATCGLYVVVSTGTGRKLDDESLSQPFVERLVQVARSIRPSLVFAKRLDRLVRRAWALGSLMLVLESCGAALGDTRRGIRTISGFDAVLVFFDATVGEEQGNLIPHQTRGGMIQRTGTVMVDGVLPYHLGRCAPSGVRCRPARRRGLACAEVPLPRQPAISASSRRGRLRPSGGL